MEILGIGFGELFLILLLILILFGPKDIVSTSKNLGRWLNRLIKSPTYKLLTQTGEELRGLPTKLMREANLEEFTKEVQQTGKDLNNQVYSIGNSISKSIDEKQIVPYPPPAKPAPPPADDAKSAPGQTDETPKAEPGQ